MRLEGRGRRVKPVAQPGRISGKASAVPAVAMKRRRLMFLEDIISVLIKSGWQIGGSGH
jgi:hypothetical protein